MGRLKIAVNTRFLLPNKLEGIGWFTGQTLHRMCHEHPEVEWHFLFDRPYDPQFLFTDQVVPHVLAPPARHPLLWYAWFEWAVPRALKQIGADLFISPDGFNSLRSDCPSLMVVHDLAFEHFPEHINWLVRHYYQYFTPRYAQKAQRIATVSEFSKQDLVQRYGIDANKIDVTCNGSHRHFKPLSDQEQKSVRQEFTQGKPYIIYAGSQHPRKNVCALLEAFDRFKAQGHPHQLVLAGRKAWHTEAIERCYESMRYQNEVVRTGHLSMETLSQLVGAADMMCYASLFEGFGIPILEAMHCDVPVITSNVSSMPEVGGDAAVLVDPHSVDAISDAMHQLVVDDTLRQQCITRGRIQREQFSWNRAGDLLWESVERCVAKRSTEY